MLFRTERHVKQGSRAQSFRNWLKLEVSHYFFFHPIEADIDTTTANASAFSRALRRPPVNSDWFMTQCAPAKIGQNNCHGNDFYLKCYLFAARDVDFSYYGLSRHSRCVSRILQETHHTRLPERDSYSSGCNDNDADGNNNNNNNNNVSNGSIHGNIRTYRGAYF